MFGSVGREDIELSIYLDIKDPQSGETRYFKEKTCEIQMVIYVAPYFGIDLGTTYSCIAYQEPFLDQKTKTRQTKIVVMDGTKMEHCIPSSVYFGPDRRIYIGNDARDQALEHNDYKNLIYDVKRIIGRSSEDPALKTFNET